LDCTNNQRSIPFGYLLHLLVQDHHVLFVFSGAFRAEEVDGVRDDGSGDTTMFDVQTLSEAFLNMTLISACLTDEAFFW
jgi:hypothetical protein